MGLLNGQIAKAIYAGFKGKLLKGQLRRSFMAASAGLDQRGDPIAEDDQLFDCQGFTEAYSDYFRVISGIPDLDLKVNIFAQSLATDPTKDDKVEMPKGSGLWYLLRKVEKDPATALWTCRATRVEAPS